jgi:mannose-1-phosphate guanylyltransferase / mannose-6-phosphate isomerase
MSCAGSDANQGTLAAPVPRIAAMSCHGGHDEQNPTGDYVRRLRHTRVAGIAGKFTKTIHSPDRRPVDLPVDRRPGRWTFEPPVVITNFDYRFRVAEQLKEIEAEATILLEPERRDSAAAVGAGAAWATTGDRKTIVAVLAADHVFKDGKKFAELCAQAGVAAAAGEIVVFGVPPDHPAPGYGYIHPGEPLAVDPRFRRVERFVEKPDEERARTFIEDGYLWNSGNFVFRADVMLEELARCEPEIAAAATQALAGLDLGFVALDREF